PGRDVERWVGRSNQSSRGIRVENQRIVQLGPQALDDRIHAGLNRRQQLLLPLAGAILQLVGARLHALLHRLQILLFGRARRGRERDRLLVKRRHRRVELLLQLLDLGAVAVYFLQIRRFGDRVAGRALQDFPGVDVGDLQRPRRGRRALGGRDRRRRGERGDGGERNEHETLHKPGTPG